MSPLHLSLLTTLSPLSGTGLPVVPPCTFLAWSSLTHFSSSHPAFTYIVYNLKQIFLLQSSSLYSTTISCLSQGHKASHSNAHVTRHQPKVTDFSTTSTATWPYPVSGLPPSPRTAWSIHSKEAKPIKWAVQGPLYTVLQTKFTPYKSVVHHPETRKSQDTSSSDPQFVTETSQVVTLSTFVFNVKQLLTASGILTYSLATSHTLYWYSFQLRGPAPPNQGHGP